MLEAVKETVETNFHNTTKVFLANKTKHKAQAFCIDWEKFIFGEGNIANYFEDKDDINAPKYISLRSPVGKAISVEYLSTHYFNENVMKIKRQKEKELKGL